MTNQSDWFTTSGMSLDYEIVKGKTVRFPMLGTNKYVDCKLDLFYDNEFEVYRYMFGYNDIVGGPFDINRGVILED